MLRFISIYTAATLIAFCIHGADEGGSLKGAVIFDGEAPAPVQIPIPPNDQPGCKCKAAPDERLVVDKTSKGIKWAVVRIMDVQAPDAPKNSVPPEITQKGCAFSPHVIVVVPDSDLTILNPDAITHNFHSVPNDIANKACNFVISGTELQKVCKRIYLKEPEIVSIKCDIHPWMSGVVVLHDPRYCAVTGTDGKFEIKNVPPGKYVVKIFQEKCGEKELNVEIKAGTATDMGDVKMKLPK